MRHASQFTRKYKHNFKTKKKSRPTHRRVKPVPIRVERRNVTMQLEPMAPPKTISDLSQSYMTNRIQSYLGTQVSPHSPHVSANRMATMPQNYYKLKPNLHRRLIEQNVSYDSRGRVNCSPIPLTLPEFKYELEQLYRKYNIIPVPLSPEDEQVFNTRMKRYECNFQLYDKEMVKRRNDLLTKYGNRPMIKNKLRIPEFPRSPSPESSD